MLQRGRQWRRTAGNGCFTPLSPTEPTNQRYYIIRSCFSYLPIVRRNLSYQLIYIWISPRACPSAGAVYCLLRSDNSSLCAKCFSCPWLMIDFIAILLSKKRDSNFYCDGWIFWGKNWKLKRKIERLISCAVSSGDKSFSWVVIVSVLKFVGVDVCDVVITCSANCSTNYSSSQAISWLSGQRLDMLALVGFYFD